MSFRLRSLTISGFRSFSGEERFELPRRRGLYLLSGDNQIEPDLGANGAGKSSLWDALVWVLFGKTARGLRASSIASWSGDSLTRVVAEIEVGDRAVRIMRTWSPNALLVSEDGKPEQPMAQEALEELIGCTYDQYLQTVVLGQFGRYFFDLAPAEKLAVFSEILDLRSWVERSKRAKLQADGLAGEMGDLQTEIGRSDGYLQGLREELTSLEARKAEIAAEALSKAAERRERRRDAEAARTSLEARLRELGGATATETASAEGARKKLLAADGEDRKAYGQVAAAEAMATQADEDAKEAAKLRGSCPYCGHKLSAAHAKTMADEAKAAKKKATDALKAAKKKKHATEEKLKKADAAMEKHDRALESLGTQTADMRTRLRGILAELEHLDEEEEASELKKLRKREQELHDKIEHEEKQAATHAHKLKKLGRKERRTRFWVKGFRDLRLWVIQDALIEFELAVNSSLHDLGLRGWSVKFDVERENKSGGVSKGFSVFIRSPMSEKPVPWEAWSGGETQRLRIAGSAGLADLIRNRTGWGTDIEVWDEPTSHLSVQGISDLLQFFKSRSSGLRRQVWIIDHRSPDAGEFTGEFRVVRDESGSRVEEV